SPNRRFVMRDDGQGFMLFDAATGKRYCEFNPTRPAERPGYVGPFCISGDNRLLVRTGSDSGRTRIDLHDTITGAKMRSLFPDGIWGNSAGNLVPSPDGKFLMTSFHNHFVEEFDLWNLYIGKHLYHIRGDRAVFAPDGKTLAIVGMDAQGVVLHQTATGK